MNLDKLYIFYEVVYNIASTREGGGGGEETPPPD